MSASICMTEEVIPVLSAYAWGAMSGTAYYEGICAE